MWPRAIEMSCRSGSAVSPSESSPSPTSSRPRFRGGASVQTRSDVIAIDLPRAPADSGDRRAVGSPLGLLPHLSLGIVLADAVLRLIMALAPRV